MSEAPCVGSGFCCQRAPCPFGVWDAVAGQCVYLTPWTDDDLTDDDGRVPRHRCSKHDEIVKHPLAHFAPAFGAGCCQPLFNVARDRIVRALNQRSLNGTSTDTTHLEPGPTQGTARHLGARTSDSRAPDSDRPHLDRQTPEPGTERGRGA